MTTPDWTRARYAYHAGEFAECEQILRGMCESPADRPFALYNLSVLYAEIGRKDWKDFYREAVELEPGLLSKIGMRTILRRDEFNARKRVFETVDELPEIRLV